MPSAFCLHATARPRSCPSPHTSFVCKPWKSKREPSSFWRARPVGLCPQSLRVSHLLCTILVSFKSRMTATLQLLAGRLNVTGNADMILRHELVGPESPGNPRPLENLPGTSPRRVWVVPVITSAKRKQSAEENLPSFASGKREDGLTIP